MNYKKGMEIPDGYILRGIKSYSLYKPYKTKVCTDCGNEFKSKQDRKITCDKCLIKRRKNKTK